MRTLALALLILLAGRAQATGEINVLTDLLSPFPPGCVAVSLPQAPIDGDNLLYNDDIWVPGASGQGENNRVNVKIWRVGCHDPGFSVVMVRLTKLSGPDPVLVPQVFADFGVVEQPFHQGQLIRHPAVGNVGATGNVVTEDGTTFMLGVDQISVTGETRFFPEDYNDLFTLELDWSAFTPGEGPLGELFFIDEYLPELDPTQFEFPILHGRMSGLYDFEGLPSTGLSLHIAELVDDTNFVFAIFFTYLDGQPFWVVGNTGGIEQPFDLVELDMRRFEGGDFFTAPPFSFGEGELPSHSIGTMTLEALDCNAVLLNYDFSDTGLGSGSLVGERLSRTAGYDCNPWE